ncbi:hypothetical protein SUGI_0931740 [Cryptomeria japonica]|nr:hypothetical protein SUGI_0931740 [Cryptomeria japonica]
MMKREGPKFNRDNFKIWKDIMKIYIKSLDAQHWNYVENAYVIPSGILTDDYKREIQENGQVMEALISNLSDVEFIDVQDKDNLKDVWDKMEFIYGGDEHVKQAKEESLRGKFEDMRMVEGETIQQYGIRIKTMVGEIKSTGGTIDDATIVNKVLRSRLPVYAIRVAAIQELRSINKTKVSLDSIIAKLTAYELNGYDGSVQKTKLAFRASSSSAPTKKGKEVSTNYESRLSKDMDDEEILMEFEALLTKRLPKGTRKYRGKLPLEYFSWNKIGHIAVNCPNNYNKDKLERFRKYKGVDRRNCLVAVDEGVIDEEYEDEKNEYIVFVVVKEELYDQKALVSHIDNSNE